MLLSFYNDISINERIIEIREYKKRIPTRLRDRN